MTRLNLKKKIAMKKDQQLACDQLLGCLSPEEQLTLNKNFNLAYEQEIECKNIY